MVTIVAMCGVINDRYSQAVSSVSITVYSLLIDEDDLRDVKSAVADLAGRWKDLGISLGIRSSTLNTIDSPSASDCLREMLALWLRQSYTVRTIIIITLLLVHYTKHSSFLSSLGWRNLHASTDLS